ncbi:hypothetical protein B0H14DRAFT_2340679 [Mycena olivaceomarginata]|nr:hypothetical protein B0H14DRAFT_2340679 [Mycena olivaceomarginata]
MGGPKAAMTGRYRKASHRRGYAFSSRAARPGVPTLPTVSMRRRRSAAGCTSKRASFPGRAAANQHNVVPDSVAQPPPNRSMSTAPVGFPYNLPVPAPPSTPRTTRQQMLRNEMSESLRHNLLWQRKLSRTDTIGPQPRRTKSTVNVPSVAALAGQGGRQPEKSLVRVTPRAPGAERRETLPPMDPPVPEGGSKKKLVRNLSWANTSDYHARGW